MTGLKGGGGSSPKGNTYLGPYGETQPELIILPPTSMPFFFLPPPTDNLLPHSTSSRQPTSAHSPRYTPLRNPQRRALPYLSYPSQIALRPYTAHACLRNSEQPWSTPPPTVSGGVKRTPSLHYLSSFNSSSSLVEGLLWVFSNFSTIGSPSILLPFAGIEPALQQYQPTKHRS